MQYYIIVERTKLNILIKKGTIVMNKLIDDFWDLAKKHSNAGIYVVAMLMFGLSKQLRSVTHALLSGALGNCLVRLDVIVSSVLAVYFLAIIALLIYADLTHESFGWKLVDAFNDCLTLFYKPVLMWAQLLTVVYISSSSATAITSLMGSLGWLTWLMAVAAVTQGLLAFLMLIAKKD